MRKMRTMKGLGRTELAILLAVMLIVMGITVLLLGGFNFGGGDLRDANSLAYWTANTTGPFAITDWTKLNTTMYLTVSNRDGQLYILRRIVLGNVTADLEAGWTVGPYSEKNISIRGLTVCDPSIDPSYSYKVAFYYDGGPSTNLTNLSQIGAQPLAGRCSG
ncbi:MAG: hypothetical protein KGH63_01690 [Candidatus Micrarchaeota archaeon]|nr:hypothetical protein [Candidatus Micrarchaeota archaeon]